ncbi:MAG: hypothetical protein COA33_007170 [Fluviicola sp.]|nr:hypothetical protein [Fluviicola sp.]
MRKVLFIIITLSSFFSEGQDGSVVYDRFFDEPVIQVQVFNSKNDIIGISNDYGEVVIAKSQFPITLKRRGYVERVVKRMEDTISFESTVQLIDEVAAKPINKMNLYNSIIDKSNALASRNIGDVKGRYIESILLIDKNSGDTMIIENSCDLLIRRNASKRKVKYEYYFNALKKAVDFNPKSNPYESIIDDTSAVEGLLNFGMTFNQMVSFDLLDKKLFEVNFEEKEIERRKSLNSTELIFTKNEGYSSKIQIIAVDSVMTFWSRSSFYPEKEHQSKNYLHYSKVSNQIEFQDESDYLFNSLLFNTILDIGNASGEFRVEILKGFIKDDSVIIEPINKTKKVEKCFKSIEAGNDFINRFQFNSLKK